MILFDDFVLVTAVCHGVVLEVLREVVVDVYQDILVRRTKLLVGLSRNYAFVGNTENFVWRNIDLQVGSRVSFSVAEPAIDGILGVGEHFVEGSQYFGFQVIGSLVNNLTSERAHVPVWAHHQRALRQVNSLYVNNRLHS